MSVKQETQHSTAQPHSASNHHIAHDLLDSYSMLNKTKSASFHQKEPNLKREPFYAGLPAAKRSAEPVLL